MNVDKFIRRFSPISFGGRDEEWITLNTMRIVIRHSGLSQIPASL